MKKDARPPIDRSRLTDSERLDVLCTWAEERGWHVEFEDQHPLEKLLPPHQRTIDEADLTTRTIVIGKAQSKRSQVYSLLHECGHVLENEAGDRLFQGHRYGRRSRIGRCATIESEILAWRAGWRLALRLGLFEDHQAGAYEREAARWVYRYIDRKGLAVDIREAS